MSILSLLAYRDWFEDELWAFQGGKDGVLPCVWENELPSFPQPETISKMLVNQMLLCFGVMFVTQDSSGMLSLLGILEQSLKTGRRHVLHSTSVTNVCVGLLYGLKAMLTYDSQPLETDILIATQGIFQIIFLWCKCNFTFYLLRFVSRCVVRSLDYWKG
ncbi:hypothetical protein Lser_V15G41004 [Lactuca serriola]